MSSTRGFVLIDDGEVGRFGPALAWADRAWVGSLDVLVDGSAAAPGIIARRASAFEAPAVTVWSVHGRSLSPAGPADPDAPGDPEAGGSVPALLASRGLEVVSEHGVVRGEVLGLEVARTVGGVLQVGVGRHDRNARRDMRPDEDLGAALDEAASAVRALRRPGAPPHPANTLARSRWLRSLVVGSAAARAGLGLEDLSDLRTVAPPLPWFDLPEARAAPAVGRLPTGSEVVVVFSVGIDLDLVPTAADCRLTYGPDAALWLIVPEGDDLPVTRSLASRLRDPAIVQVVRRDWTSAL